MSKLFGVIEGFYGAPWSFGNRTHLFQFFKSVPGINCYIYAPKDDEKHRNNWYIGSMTDETARKLKIKLDFLAPGKTYEATIYEDGAGADYIKNPYPVAIRKIKVKKGQLLKLSLAASGGCAISIKEN